MAPSNSRNRMTRPLRTRPSQRAGPEIGASSAIVGRASPMVLPACMFIARLLRSIDAAWPKDERDGRNSTGDGNISCISPFSAFRHGLCSARPRRKRVCPLRSNFGRKFAPDSIHSPNQAAGSVFGYLNLGELVMGPAYLPDSKQEFPDVRDCLDEQPLRGDEFGDDETSDGLMSLLEENARLRGLVIKLTDIILKN